MSIEAVAREAGVGKPAIYRRFRDKAELVASVIAGRLPTLDPPDLGDTRAELWRAVQQGLPGDGLSYVGLIGGLIAEQNRHPELIEAFRSSVLLPRREIVRAIVRRGQAARRREPGRPRRRHRPDRRLAFSRACLPVPIPARAGDAPPSRRGGKSSEKGSSHDRVRDRYRDRPAGPGGVRARHRSGQPTPGRRTRSRSSRRAPDRSVSVHACARCIGHPAVGSPRRWSRSPNTSPIVCSRSA